MKITTIYKNELTPSQIARLLSDYVDKHGKPAYPIAVDTEGEEIEIQDFDLETEES